MLKNFQFGDSEKYKQFFFSIALFGRVTQKWRNKEGDIPYLPSYLGTPGASAAAYYRHEPEASSRRPHQCAEPKHWEHLFLLFSGHQWATRTRVAVCKMEPKGNVNIAGDDFACNSTTPSPNTEFFLVSCEYNNH